MTLRLRELLELSGIQNRLSFTGDINVDITAFTDDSRRAAEGVLFASTAEGRKFLPDAEKKASAVLVGADEKTNHSVVVRTNSMARDHGVLASALYHHPSRKLQLVGVTGTNGKTSTTWMLRHIWNELGLRNGVIGTLGVFWTGPDGKEKRLETGFTTPRAGDLHRILADMLSDGVTHVAMEASSEALHLGRLSGCHFAACGFINLTVDHLNYHGDMESYFDAKMELLRLTADSNGSMVVFVSGDYGERAREVAESLEPDNLFVLRDIPELDLPVPTEFNRINANMAIHLSGVVGDDLSRAKESLKNLPPIPGRFNVITPGDVSVKKARRYGIVDYAHTPDALESVLREAKRFGARRIACVIGCGGDRDRTKRPVMGGIAARFSDIAFITDDNPRSEDPAHIRREVLQGALDVNASAREIPGRREAIAEAVKWLAAVSELPAAVVVAGKGHESVQIFKDRREHFSDAEELRAAFAKAGL